MSMKFRDPRTGEIMEEVEIVDEFHKDPLARQTPEEALRYIRSNNLTLDTDLYELTMAAGYCVLGKCRNHACFDLYYRQNPDNGAFCVFTGLHSVIDYINNLELYSDDIDYLRSLGIFSSEGLENLECSVRFTGDVYAVPEGTVVFPNEPLIRVNAPISEAQVLETTLLALVGHQTLIATKAARLCIASRGASVVDFGTRRAHGVQAALLGARAAYIGGCSGTSNVRAGKMFGVPVRGTHAHSWVESFDTEEQAFEGYADTFPENAILLVDTYDTLGGVKAAIEVARKMEAKGKKLQAIRIDSGDLAYYSKAARNMLDQAGLTYVKILASSDLDEWLIQSLRDQGAKIDVWCVGTRLITSYSTPALGVVYKLMAFEDDSGILQPKIKISQNPRKVTNPGQKKIVRFYNGDDRMIGDLLMEVDEPLPRDRPVQAHHPMYDYMKKIYRPPYKAEEIMVPIFKDGKQVYDPPNLEDVRKRAFDQIARLEPEYKRITNPHIYKVSLSDELHGIKNSLLSMHQERED